MTDLVPLFNCTPEGTLLATVELGGATDPL